MRRYSILLLNLAIVLSLAFSGVLSELLMQTSVTPGSATARVAGPSSVSAEPASQQAKKARRNRDRDRTQANRKRDRKQNDRASDRKRNDKKQERGKRQQRDEEQSGLVRTGNWEDQCIGPNTIRLKKSEFCSHGPDPAPPGFDVQRPVALPSLATPGQAPPSIDCEPDGESGFRIHVLYVRSTSTPPLSPSLLTSIRTWVGEMDNIFQENAEATGPTRNLRFVHDAVCQVVVDEVVVTTAALDDFDTMINQLEKKGYDRAQRIYLSFVDATEYCGIGTLWNDDRESGTANWNNFGPSYSRVDAGCWEGWIAAHEVMHNLGGVQLSAPNTSNGFHCIDEYDIMCYLDGPTSPPMRTDCPNAALDKTLLDCNHDDYYNTNPAPGSYLTTHWNPANNRFLIGAPESVLPPDYEFPEVQWVAPVRNDEEFEVNGGTIPLEAEATDNVGVQRVEFWRWDNEDNDWVPLGTDFAAPYSSSLDVGVLSPGINYLSADAYDATERSEYELITINKPSPAVGPPPVDPPTTVSDKKKDKKKRKGKRKKGKKRR